MGGKQSKLKKEIEALKAATAKHQEDAETLRGEKRMLEFKLHALQEMTAKAQIEAETAAKLALESEEKVKALKWELVRRLSVPAANSSGSIPTSPAGPTDKLSTTSSSLSSFGTSTTDTSTSAIPRVPINWTLKEGVTLRRSNTSCVPTTRSKPELNLNKKQPTDCGTINTSMQRVSLAKPEPRDARTEPAGKMLSDQAADAKLPPIEAGVVVKCSKPPPVDVDIFAPVKRRSSTKEMPTPIAEAKPKDAERVESFHKGERGSPRSESEIGGQGRVSVKKNNDEAVGESAAPRRGIHAATKGGDRLAGSRTDDVLALSDDEDD